MNLPPQLPGTNVTNELDNRDLMEGKSNHIPIIAESTPYFDENRSSVEASL